jgi:hypothetical protein
MNIPFRLSAAVSGILLAISVCRAGVGDTNPTGVSGQFNGNVTTAGSYDPFTGNATRSIADLVTPRAVGEHALAFTRTLNTRDAPSGAPGAGAPQFGEAGGWRHSYQWTIEELEIPTDGGNVVRPATYSVHYPDGRRVSFSRNSASSDPYFGAAHSGISDRFDPLPQNGFDCYLVTADGSRVWFQATEVPSVGGGTVTFSYALRGIIDPHGLLTTINGAVDAASGEFRITTITEPGGRSLTLVYRQVTSAEGNLGDVVIGKVEERLQPGAVVHRTVTYGYLPYESEGGGRIYTSLSSVSYYGDSALTANYRYEDSNNKLQDHRPLIARCDDPLYGGPMTKIAYAFVPQEQGGAYGQIESENHTPDGIQIGVAVSTISYPNANHRVETRGDGPSRSFTYEQGYLKSWTDFKGEAFLQGRTSGDAGFVSSFTDPRGADHKTEFERHPWTGAIKATLLAFRPHGPETSVATTSEQTSLWDRESKTRYELSEERGVEW